MSSAWAIYGDRGRSPQAADFLGLGKPRPVQRPTRRPRPRLLRPPATSASWSAKASARRAICASARMPPTNPTTSASVSATAMNRSTGLTAVAPARRAAGPGRGSPGAGTGSTRPRAPARPRPPDLRPARASQARGRGRRGSAAPHGRAHGDDDRQGVARLIRACEIGRSHGASTVRCGQGEAGVATPHLTRPPSASTA